MWKVGHHVVTFNDMHFAFCHSKTTPAVLGGPSPTQAVDARHCPSPDLVTFNALLSAFEKAAQWPRGAERRGSRVGTT